MAQVKFRTLLAALLVALAVGGAVAPAFAQYPPTVGAGRVTRSTLMKCQCTQFTGDGFAPGSAVTIVDQHPDGSEHTVRVVVADSKGAFKTKVCFDESSPEGRHTLIARGQDAQGNPREVRAVVTVKGSICFRRGDEVHAGRFERGEGGLPGTGSDATLPALLLGFGLVCAGSGVVFVARRRGYAVS